MAAPGNETWQWRDTKGWMDYSPADMAVLNAAMPGSRVSLGGGKYTVDLTRMKQTNTATKYERDIRKKPTASAAATTVTVHMTSSTGSASSPGPASADSAPEGGEGGDDDDGAVLGPDDKTGVVWMFDNGSRFQKYDAATSKAVEDAFTAGQPSTTYSFGKHSYTVDFTHGVQINDGTGAERDLKRFMDGVETPLIKESPEDAAAASILPEHYDQCAAADIPASETCAVCMDDFGGAGPAPAGALDTPIVRLKNCTYPHFFHLDCITNSFKALGRKCPVCGAVYGFEGPMPKGTMDVQTLAVGEEPCDGYESFGTIVINYAFPGGRQGKKDPKPGKRYGGTHRTAYLPDNIEGREVLDLLRRAFDAKVTFRIGQSVTTGQDNTVIWNGIHHKTSTSGGAWGYPDPTYFARVKGELGEFGIK